MPGPAPGSPWQPGPGSGAPPNYSGGGGGYEGGVPGWTPPGSSPPPANPWDPIAGPYLPQNPNPGFQPEIPGYGPAPPAGGTPGNPWQRPGSGLNSGPLAPGVPEGAVAKGGTGIGNLGGAFTMPGPNIPRPQQTDTTGLDSLFGQTRPPQTVGAESGLGGIASQFQELAGQNVTNVDDLSQRMRASLTPGMMEEVRGIREGMSRRGLTGSRAEEQAVRRATEGFEQNLGDQEASMRMQADLQNRQAQMGALSAAGGMYGQQGGLQMGAQELAERARQGDMNAMMQLRQLQSSEQFQYADLAERARQGDQQAGIQLAQLKSQDYWQGQGMQLNWAQLEEQARMGDQNSKIQLAQLQFNYADLSERARQGDVQAQITLQQLNSTDYWQSRGDQLGWAQLQEAARSGDMNRLMQLFGIQSDSGGQAMQFLTSIFGDLLGYDMGTDYEPSQPPVPPGLSGIGNMVPMFSGGAGGAY